MTTTDRSTTADDLLRTAESDDAARFELIQGDLVALMPAGGRHGVCCSCVASLLQHFVKGRKLGRVATNDTGLWIERNPDTVLAPDVVYWSFERLPEMPEGFVEVPPELAVEVVSPYDTQSQLHRKVLRYLDHGIRSVWIVDPSTRTITIYHSRRDVRILGPDDPVDGEEVLPGFSCQVNEFFDAAVADDR